MKFNTQQPLPFVTSNTVQVHSIFPTLQGEGPFTGHRAIFVRLSGCNLQCPGCDTEYTGGTEYTVEGLKHEIENTMWREAWVGDDKRLIVITGGEPFRQSSAIEVMNLLTNCGYTVQVETNGTFPVDGLHEDVVVICSPKSGSVHKSVAKRANAFKYVLSETSYNPDDLLPVRVLRHSVAKEVYRPEYNYEGPIYIQPADPVDDDAQYVKNVKLCIEAAMKFGYILQLQVHKIVGVA